MKIYPDPNKPAGDRGFTEEEIRSGHIYLLADVKCESCGKELAASYVGSIDRGVCPKCGGCMR